MYHLENVSSKQGAFPNHLWNCIQDRSAPCSSVFLTSTLGDVQPCLGLSGLLGVFSFISREMVEQERANKIRGTQVNSEECGSFTCSTAADSWSLLITKIPGPETRRRIETAFVKDATFFYCSYTTSLMICIYIWKLVKLFFSLELYLVLYSRYGFFVANAIKTNWLTDWCHSELCKSLFVDMMVKGQT